jgi:hypothetical protein
MKGLRKASRRSFLRQVAGGAAGIGAMGLIGGRAAVAAETILDPARTSDSDTGAGSDPASRSDSDPTSAPAGCSDNDRGSNSDPIGRGRRCRNNNGRTYTGLSDNDRGSSADPHGYGRRRQAPRACSDSDTGRSDPVRSRGSDRDAGIRDPSGRGRNCR